MSSLIEQISSDLMVPEIVIKNALQHSFVKYRKIIVRKRSGSGTRIMLQPASELKLVQEWLLSKVLLSLPKSSLASAFFKGASILINASIHKNSLYSVRVDFKNFFSSIKFIDLSQTLSNNRSILPSWVATQEFENIVKRSCFDREGCLPIGYLTSPCISNAVMYQIDEIIKNSILIDDNRFGMGKLSRYADDFVFSTNKKGACREFVTEMHSILKKINTPKLTINEKKTRYMSLLGGSTFITGLRVNQKSIIRVHPEYRDNVRMLLKLYANGKLNPQEHQTLKGHLAYIEHVDPGLFTRLSYRYYAAIAQLRT